MDEIIYRQRNAPSPMTGRRFLLGAAGIVLRLAVAQIVVNALIAVSGMGLLNILFYLYAVALLVAFMRRTVAGSVYALKESELVLQSLLGDSTTAVVDVPLERVTALRPVARCENLRLYCAQVTAVDAAAKPGLRMRAAFAASLLSARLARLLAGKRAQEELGWAVLFEEEGRLRACVFRPDEGLLSALALALPDTFGQDDRAAREKIRTIYARALQRAFPAQYPHVLPLIREEDMRWAQDELNRQKGEREAERRDNAAHKAARAAAKERRRKGKKKRPRGRQKDKGTEASDEVHDDPV